MNAPPKLSALPRFGKLLPCLSAGFAGAALGCALLIQQSLAQQREDFETGARIAHRLLSQRAVQHEAVLVTLSLLRATPDARLTAVYPQVLQLRQRTVGETWPGPDRLRTALEAAEQSSRKPQLAAAYMATGRFWIVMPTPNGAGAAAEAHALEVSLALMVPWSEWPFGASPEAMQASSTRAWLVHGGAAFAMHAEAASSATNPPLALRQFTFDKRLAAESQPFTLHVEQNYRIADLPWLSLALWLAAWSALLAGGVHMLRLRRARRRAEALLRLGQVSRLNALGEMAAGLAHELNQPLTAVLANTQAAMRLLDDDPPEADAARAAMTQAAAQARRAADVVARLRRSIERPGGKCVTVDLAELVRSSANLLEPECRRRGVAMAVSGADAVPVAADPVALEQIVHNLIGNALNALEATPAPSLQLAVTRDPAARQARLSVRDNGPGVAAAVRDHLFEPFVSARPGGLGLGLSLCDTLATEMGGRLRHQAASPGAEFILELPLARSDDAGQAARRPA